jgi:putative ATPase
MAQPLAARLRPTSLEQFVGQAHLLAPHSPLKRSIESGKLHSMIFWGPPGTGKTTLGQIVANTSQAEFIKLSAVMAGVKDIRDAVSQAQNNKDHLNQDTVVFIDEIHRFNKAQQDALLPYVEDGTIFLIGATTENPSFEVNNALLSRCRVYTLKSLSSENLTQILDQALESTSTTLDIESKESLVQAADGDARRLLTLLEIVLQQLTHLEDKTLSKAELEALLRQDYRQFDKKGEHFYDQISALHKAVRGSSPDGALYWLCRMLDGGCDPLYIARRVVRMASEDIGNADPRALTIAFDAWNALERLGQPEGELVLAQAVVYMASAPKSNAVYTAFKAAMQDVKNSASHPVPLHLRNAPTKLMKNIGYGKMYRYDHDEPQAFSKGQTYFPDEIGEKKYYYPVTRGLEIKIKEKLDALRPVTAKDPTSSSPT